MTTMKTAISIDSLLMQEVDTWAQELKISRSRLFAMGVEKLIRQYKNKRMLDALNKVYDDPSYDEPSAEEGEHLEAIYTEFGDLMVDEGW